MLNDGKETALSRAVAGARPAIVLAVIFSLFINLLALVAPLYMMQVYDRVLSSKNITTLIMLSLIAVALFIVYGILEMLRSRLLIRGGITFEKNIRSPLYVSLLSATIRKTAAADSQPARDADSIREFLTGSSLLALCDVPWVPIFIFACFLIHPAFGFLAIGSSIFMCGLAFANEFATRSTLAKATTAAISAHRDLSATLRNAEVLHAMAMSAGLQARWGDRRDEQIGCQAVASDRAGGIAATIRSSRQLIQVIILGGGAYLAITGSISVGAIIGASILVGRALAPIEVAVAHWKTIVIARGAWGRLRELFASTASNQSRTSLPEPRGNISVENAVVTAPNGKRTTLRDVTFQIPAGTVLAIVGPSAAGKSTLLRALLGVWPMSSGTVRIDGSELSHWDPAELGPNVGYLPQDVELFEGTIAQNIARFTSCDDSAVIEAARFAGIHDMVQHFREGYDTRIGEGGTTLSAGQRQRVGLARAVFGGPSIIMLDEPNANLDVHGEEALIQAIQRLKSQGKTVLFVTHKPSLLFVADKVLLLNDGAVDAFGDCDDILSGRFADPKHISNTGGGEVLSPIDGWKQSFFQGAPQSGAKQKLVLAAQPSKAKLSPLVRELEIPDGTGMVAQDKFARRSVDRGLGDLNNYRANGLKITGNSTPTRREPRIAGREKWQGRFTAEHGTGDTSRIREFGGKLWEDYEVFTRRTLNELEIAYMFVDGIAGQLSEETEPESVIVAWGYTIDGRQVLLHLKTGSLEHADTTEAFFEDMRGRGLSVPLMVTSVGVPSVIKAIQHFMPSAGRQRCISSRMRDLAGKVPVEYWREFQGRVKAVYQAPSRMIAQERAKVIVTDYADRLANAISCFIDDFDACLVHLRFPLEHRPAIQSTNLLEQIWSDQRRHLKSIPNAPVEHAFLKLMFASLFAMEGRQAIAVTDLELRQMTAARKGVNHEYEPAPSLDGLQTFSPGLDQISEIHMGRT
jgi:ATP-binding cassette, subfamily C, bacterial RsaD